jgi:hypothetical protein
MGRILEIYIGFQTSITRTYPKIRWSKMSAQANLRKAIQFSDFLHQRILTVGPTFGQPAQGSFHHPVAGWELGLAWDRALLYFRFISQSPRLDVRDVAVLADKLMDIIKMIAFIQAGMLLAAGCIVSLAVLTGFETAKLNCFGALVITRIKVYSASFDATKGLPAT